MNNYNELTKKVKIGIDKYLGFNSDELFENTDCKIFGGSIRDIISDLNIHDVDILCGTQSCKILHELLELKGYIFHTDLHHKDLGLLYKNINVISEPHTFTKGDKIVQLIRPSSTVNLPSIDYMKHLDNLINNVDISCCGVSYDGNKIYENYTNAIMHCLCKIFIVNKYAKMYNNERTELRKYKLIDRGWKIFNSKIDEYKLIREIQTKKLLNCK